MSLATADAVDRWLRKAMGDEEYASVKVCEACIVEDGGLHVRFIVLTASRILATVRRSAPCGSGNIQRDVTRLHDVRILIGFLPIRAIASFSALGKLQCDLASPRAKIAHSIQRADNSCRRTRLRS